MIKKYLNILRGSKYYEMNGTILTITSYHTGDAVSIDLGQITEEVLAEILVYDEVDEEYYGEEDYD